jgi:hypothetical protein
VVLCVQSKDAETFYQWVCANTSRTVLCQYIPNRPGAYNTPKNDPRGGKSMNKQSVSASVVEPW